MNAKLRGLLFAALAATGFAGTAHANITYSVSGVQVSTGGMLAGSFTTNDSRTAVVSFDIATPATGAFSAFDYTPASASLSAATLPSQFFRLDTPGNQQELQLYFASGLSSNGGTLLTTSSYENQPTGGNRFLSGFVTAQSAPPVSSVPEPASLLLVAAGVAAVGFGRGRRAADRAA